MMNRILLLACVLIFARSAQAQGSYIPLHHESYHYMDRLDIRYHKLIQNSHTNVKPFKRKMVAEHAQALRFDRLSLSSATEKQLDWLLLDNSEWVDSASFPSKKPVLKHFYKIPDALYSVDVEDFNLKLNPVLSVWAGSESNNDEFKFVNTRGIELRANIKEKVSFYTYVGENQWRPESWVQQRIEDYEAVPGEGFYKEFKDNGVSADYFTARGYINFNVLEYFDLQLGHDKNFIGNGYRSLLLSDNANNQFFFKLNTRIWKFNYQNIWAELTADYDRGVDRLLDKKYGVFHHLNLSITDWAEVGLFEGVILVRDGYFELQYLNPLIFYRSIEQDLGSPDNAFVGMDYKLNFLNHFSFYGQLMLDEFNFTHIRARDGWWANKFGVQAGLKYIDMGGIERLDGQIEFNTVRPYTYTHNVGSGSIPNYTHYNQELAHPLGANFREFIAIVSYEMPRNVVLEWKHFYMHEGLDTADSHWGKDIFKPTNGLLTEQEFNNEITQGLGQKTHLSHLSARWQFKHLYYLNARLSVRSSIKENDLKRNNNVFFAVGLNVNLPYKTQDY